ncbi:MAG TPA: SurA N-terminal domain-containing protein [Mucilaginibacter sp.]|nr:SurA N-terminal domain-containing protein [Mucilaginibacter sp.]
MGVMTYLRERMGRILAIVIGASLAAFILGEVLRQGGSFFHADRNELGEVDGQKIAYDEYSRQLDQNTNQMKQQYRMNSLPPQFVTRLQQETWDQKVNEIILDDETDKLGLVVSTDELKSMISGDNPSPQIMQAFADPNTGQFDKVRFINFLQGLPSAPAETRARWNTFVSQMMVARRGDKFLAMATNGLYVNSLDAKDDYENRNKLANFKYTMLDYASIPDNKVTLTDDDYQSYYNEHKYEFKNKEELRSFDYVTFSAAPSKDDSAAVKEQIAKLIPEFKSSTNDSLFVQVNAENKMPLVFRGKGKLGDPKLDTVMFGAPKGFVYGPYLSDGSYKIAKLVDTKVEPDSVKARHILIDARTIGEAKALAKADSLKKLVEGGKSFADLAKQYSIDGSASKGGELGTFARGAMVPEFEDAAFSAKKGEMKIVTSQYGVHLIQVEDTKGSAKVVKVAIVDKPIAASTATQNAAYNKATSFLSGLTQDNFDAQAKKAGLTVKTADDVNALASTLPGLDNARELVRWVFKAEKGDFGNQVFVCGDQYVIPKLTTIKPVGIAPLDAIKKQIEPAVRNHVKAKQLEDKLQTAENGSSSIDQVAQKAGGKVVPVQNVVFANPVIPGLSLEYKVVGTIFGSQPNKISKPVEGAHGVYVFSVDNFIKPAPLTNAVRERETIAQTLLQRSQNQIFDAMKDKANVKDYRAKFL